MKLFRCTEDELAAQLVNNPRIYNNALVFMQSLKGRNVFQSDLENSLDEDLVFLEKANEIARNSDYYVFEVHDDWSETEGFEVYQMVNNKLLRVLGLDQSAPTDIDVKRLLKREKVKRIFTIDFLENYYGVENEEYDNADGNSIYRRVLGHDLPYDFGDIEVITLEPKYG